MKLNIIFFRHGTTHPNTEGRWAGSIDVPITDKARVQLKELAEKYPYPDVEKIFRSPMIRCLQTLEIIYPDREAEIIPEAAEFDFGDYETVSAQESYKELDGKAISRKVLTYRFPGGESFRECLERGIATIDKIAEDCIRTGYTRVALATHAMWTGVLLRYCLEPQMTPWELHCGNGMGISVELDTDEWIKDRKMHFAAFEPAGAPRPDSHNSPYLYHGD